MQSEQFTPQVSPMLTPIQWVTQRIQVPVTDACPAGEMVALNLYTVLGGPFVVFMNPDDAEAVGHAIVQDARLARTGLVIPDSIEGLDNGG